MGKKFFLFLCVITAALAFTFIAYSQTARKTLTLPGGDVVCDIDGEWNATYEHYGSLKHIENLKGPLLVIQQGTTFVGKTVKDGVWIPKGTERIRGEIDKDGMKKVQRTRPDSDWSDAKAVINKDCNKIEIDDGDGLKITLERI